ICDLGIVADRAIINGGQEIAQLRTLGAGSVMYMAPEQSLAIPVYSSKTDIFALGLILAELCKPMNFDEKFVIFNKYRRGHLSEGFEHMPELENVITWLANRTDTLRPDCEEILQHDFLANPERYITETAFMSRFRSQFEVKSIIVSGAFGIVFEAYSSVDNITYAIKREEISKNNECFEIREANILSNLVHPGIVRCYETWIESPPEGWQIETDRQLFRKFDYEGFSLYYRNRHRFIYFKMELCMTSLTEWLNLHQSRNLEQTKMWLKQIVTAVAFIHDKGIIHRNLKPSNILFTQNNDVKIGGFGIASRDEKREDISDNITRTNVGTALYMAPEQASVFALYGSKVDVFSIGLICIELFITINFEIRTEVFDDLRRG
ncbi:hypothetical protein PMAYCL1PPCAC_08273, partial [Pristionchus mayeri]